MISICQEVLRKSRHHWKERVGKYFINEIVHKDKILLHKVTREDVSLYHWYGF